MSKAVVIPATCNASVVTAFGVPVSPVTILSEGVAQSTGFLIMFGEAAFYVAKSSPDLKTTIEKLISTITELNAGLTQIATTLTSIGAGMTGPTTAPPPTLATDVATINSKVTALNAIKTELNTLKGALK